MPQIDLHRRPIYLRLSVTDRCNLRCQYCRPATKSDGGLAKATAANDELLDLVTLLDDCHPLYKIRITGGDPLLRTGLVEMVGKLAERLPDAELVLSTNAVLLDRLVKPLQSAGIRSINISLDTLDAEVCARLTRGGDLQTILRGIDTAVAAGCAIKLNTVLMQSVNRQAIADLVAFAAIRGCELRFIELMPLGEGAAIFKQEYFSCADALADLRACYEYLGTTAPSATAQRHRLMVNGRETVVGMITTVSEPFCDSCDRLRLDSHGLIYPCLRSDASIDLLTPWRAGSVERVRQMIHSVMRDKHTPDGYWPGRNMVLIGG